MMLCRVSLPHLDHLVITREGVCQILLILEFFLSDITSEIGFSDVLTLAQTIGIVGTMILTLYFSEANTSTIK